MCCGSPLPPSPWVTATRLQVLRMAQFELQGGFAFGKCPSKALHSMKITRSLLGESWPLNSDLIQGEFQPFGPWGENPSGSWRCPQSNTLLSMGRVCFFLSWVLPEHSTCNPSWSRSTLGMNSQGDTGSPSPVTPGLLPVGGPVTACHLHQLHGHSRCWSVDY